MSVYRNTHTVPFVMFSRNNLCKSWSKMLGAAINRGRIINFEFIDRIVSKKVNNIVK